jgi:hypothetical protein
MRRRRVGDLRGVRVLRLEIEQHGHLGKHRDHLPGHVLRSLRLERDWLAELRARAGLLEPDQAEAEEPRPVALARPLARSGGSRG